LNVDMRLNHWGN